MRKRETASASVLHSLADGFMSGLAAPAMIMTGRPMGAIRTRRSTLAGSWRQVGTYLGDAMTDYEAKEAAGGGRGEKQTGK